MLPLLSCTPIFVHGCFSPKQVGFKEIGFKRRWNSLQSWLWWPWLLKKISTALDVKQQFDRLSFKLSKLYRKSNWALLFYQVGLMRIVTDVPVNICVNCIAHFHECASERSPDSLDGLFGMIQRSGCYDITVGLWGDSGCFSVCNYKELLMSYLKPITRTLCSYRTWTHTQEHVFTETEKQTSLQFCLLTLLVDVLVCGVSS